MQELQITSPAFENGGWIPRCHSAYGENMSPELRLSGVVSEAVSLAVLLDDMGHPIFPEYNHWVAWNLSPSDVIPGNLSAGAIIEQPVHVEQGLAYGKHCYRGPRPPFNWKHDYRFTVYVLDVNLDIGAESNKAVVLKAMDGHILQSGMLLGKYQRRHS